MDVDPRRDHSFRIPRPDLSTSLQTPNACTGCHLKIENVAPEKRERLVRYQDWMLAAREGDDEVRRELERANRWCDEACDKWYGDQRRRDQHFGIALAAGQNGDPDASSLLQAVLSKRGYEAPAIARATALQVLREVDAAAAAEQAARALKDDHPLVRVSAASALAGGASPTRSVNLLEQALSDPVRSVRTEAARNLLEFPSQLWSDRAGAAFRKALGELVEGLKFNNDRSGAHLAMGILAEQQGRDEQAMRHYEAAIQVEPRVAGPRTNLAAVIERNLTARGQVPEDSPLLEEVRQLRKEELPLLARDVSLLPEAAPIQYRYGLALYVDGQKQAAVAPLVKAAELEPEQPAYAQAVAMLYESLEQWPEAIRWGELALRRSGGDPQYQALLQRIKASAGK